MKKLLSSTWVKILLVIIIFCLPVVGILVYADNQQKTFKEVKAVSTSIVPTKPTITPTISPAQAGETIRSADNSVAAIKPVATQATDQPQVQQNTYYITSPTQTQQAQSVQYELQNAAPTNYTASIPTPTPFISSDIETALSQLNNTLTSIDNQPIAQNVIDGKKQKAYQDWVNTNQSIYSLILSTHYKSNLNTILIAHNLQYDVIQ